LSLFILEFLGGGSGSPISGIIENDGGGSVKVIGAVPAELHEFPWLVSFQWIGGTYCTGVIISPLDVLTTASCLQVSFASGGTGLEMHAGRYFINETSEIDGIMKPAWRFILHPDYQSELDNDIAIVKLITSNPFEFNDAVKPIQLPVRGQLLSGTGIISGWGSAREEWIAPVEGLMKSEVPLIADSQCKSIYGDDFQENSMICAGNLETGGVDFCNGDIGGPLIVRNGNNGYTLAGLNSWGNGCGVAGFPGVYTEVSNFLDFINSNIN